LSDKANDSLAARKAGIGSQELGAARELIANSSGDVIVMFGGELSAEGQAVVAQLPFVLATESRRVLLHPLPLFNNSFGAHDMRMMEGTTTPEEMLDAAGDSIKAMYVAGSFLPLHFQGREDSLGKLDFLVVQELFENETTSFADVVLPAASFAEVDGTFTNNDGFVQRVRQSIPPVHQARPDWAITVQLAKELGMDFGFDMSASAVLREIGERVDAYAGLRYPVIKDETNPVQAKHKLVERREVSSELNTIRQRVEELSDNGEKLSTTPKVGHELFKIGTLTDKVAQFHLLAAGNPRPETVAISPLYQITVDGRLQKEATAAGD
jgi:predicted molibdopterin-dependent oxidoreductase YjgC